MFIYVCYLICDTSFATINGLAIIKKIVSAFYIYG